MCRSGRQIWNGTYTYIACYGSHYLLLLKFLFCLLCVQKLRCLYGLLIDLEKSCHSILLSIVFPLNFFKTIQFGGFPYFEDGWCQWTWYLDGKIGRVCTYLRKVYFSGGLKNYLCFSFLQQKGDNPLRQQRTNSLKYSSSTFGNNFNYLPLWERKCVCNLDSNSLSRDTQL